MKERHRPLLRFIFASSQRLLQPVLGLICLSYLQLNSRPCQTVPRRMLHDKGSMNSKTENWIDCSDGNYHRTAGNLNEIFKEAPSEYLTKGF